jgi:methanogenic corrinoid protein MtbC1
MPGYKQQMMEGAALTGSGPSRRDGGASRVAAAAEDESRGAAEVERIARLMDAIQAEVIPRLVLSKRSSPPTAASRADSPHHPPAALPPALVCEFRDLLLASGPVEEFLTELLARGATLDEVYSDLMAPCARELGAMWENDEANFAEVTLGLGRLQRLLREFSQDFGGDETAQPAALRVLLAAPPGEQHTFGMLMVAEYFRRDGWEAVALPMTSPAELQEAVRQEWFSVAGLTVGTSQRMESLASTIRAVRRASLNSALRIMVGGAAFAESPELATRVGADAWAEDARQAPRQARCLPGLLTTPNAV